MVFRKIEGGNGTTAKSYTIGNNDTSLQTYTAYGANNGVHNVAFPTNYYVAIFRLTEGQYARITGDNTVSTLSSKIIALQTWNTLRGSAGIVAKVTSGPLATMQQKTGLLVDIPTHAMYEVAMRAGSNALYADGTNSYNTDTLSKYIWTLSSDGYNHPVGSLLPNAWGFYDTCGLHYVFLRDGHPRSDTGAGNPCVSTVEPTLANGFVPISTYATMRLVHRQKFDYGTHNTLSRLSYAIAPNDSRSHRLAVYPDAYYPNGGK